MSYTLFRILTVLYVTANMLVAALTSLLNNLSPI